MTDEARVATFYVVLQPRGYKKAAAVAVRQSRPATDWNEIAVRVQMTLPKDAFEGWVPRVEVDIPGGTFIPPTAVVIEPEPEPEPDESVVPA